MMDTTGGINSSTASLSPLSLLSSSSSASSSVQPAATITTTVDDRAGAVQQHQQNDDMNQTAEEEQQTLEQCLVCNDVATGYHYGTPSCNGCKTFFRRTVMKNHVFQCQYGGNCPVDKTVRCACRHCRFQKCLSVGMNKDAIQQNREPIGYTKRTRRYPSAADRHSHQSQMEMMKMMRMMNGFDNSSSMSNSFISNSDSSSLSHSSSLSVPSSSFSGTDHHQHHDPVGPSSVLPFSIVGCDDGASTVGRPPPLTAVANTSFSTVKLPMSYNTALEIDVQNSKQHQQQHQHISVGTNLSQHFDTAIIGASASKLSGGGGWVGENSDDSSTSTAPIYNSNNSRQNGCGTGSDCGGVQQQKQQNGSIEHTVQQQEDMLLRRLIGLEEILIRIRNSKMCIQKTTNDLILGNGSVFDDAAMVAQMSAEPFQMPMMLYRAKQEDELYWHEREWILMIEWAKMLPVYRSLSVADKLALLRHSAITFPSLLQCFYTPNVGPDTIVLPNGVFVDRMPTILTGFQRKNCKMDSLLKPIRKIQIDQNEFAGAKAIFFLNPGNFEDGLDADDLTPEAKQHIGITRTAITTALYRYMVQKRGTEEAMDKYAKLLLLGTVIATMSCEIKEAVVVADLFDQIRFSSFARQLLLASRNEHSDDDLLQQSSSDAMFGFGGSTVVQQPPPQRQQHNAGRMMLMPTHSTQQQQQQQFQRHFVAKATVNNGITNAAMVPPNRIIDNNKQTYDSKEHRHKHQWDMSTSMHDGIIAGGGTIISDLPSATPSNASRMVHPSLASSSFLPSSSLCGDIFTAQQSEGKRQQQVASSFWHSSSQFVDTTSIAQHGGQRQQQAAVGRAPIDATHYYASMVMPISFQHQNQYQQPQQLITAINPPSIGSQNSSTSPPSL